MEINGLIIESVVVGSVGTNCYIVHKKDSEHCFVVDPGDSGDKIANYIRDQKMILDHILLTHGHFDHIQGVRDLKNAIRGEICALDVEKELLADARMNVSAMTGKYLPMEQSKEFTVEAGRPDSITEGKLRSMKAHGVTRISINPQSMKEHTLELLGRKHTVEEIREKFMLARTLGFDNINMDLIAGLPEETLEDFKETLREVEALKPDSITVHTLVIKRASRLRKEQLEQGGEMREEDACIEPMQKEAEQFCRVHGYEPYYMYRQKNKAHTTRNTNQENVAYAKPGKECLYNIFIMEELQSILALGSGGSSKIVFPEENRMERVENVKSVDDYIGRIDEMIRRKKESWR